MCLGTLPPFRINQRCAAAGLREEIFCINLNIVHKNLPFELCRLMRQLMALRMLLNAQTSRSSLTPRSMARWLVLRGDGRWPADVLVVGHEVLTIAASHHNPLNIMEFRV
jgi:hypothetical protein